MNIVRRAYAMIGSAVRSIEQACAAVPYTIVSEPAARFSTGKPIENTRALYRSDIGNCLGIHTPQFQFLQPCESLQVLESAREMIGAEWGSVAVLKGGRQLMASILLDNKITAPKRGDKVGLSLLYMDFWDGTGRAQFSLAWNVLACTNGAISRKSVLSFSEKHNGTLPSRFSDMQNRLRANLALEVGETQRIVSRLDNAEMSQEEMRVFVEKLFPSADAEKVSTRLQNTRDSVFAGFTRGTGNVGRTRWDAFNAVTEHLDWQSTFRETEFSREDNRLVSLLNGSAANVRNRALELLLA